MVHGQAVALRPEQESDERRQVERLERRAPARDERDRAPVARRTARAAPGRSPPPGTKRLRAERVRTARREGGGTRRRRRPSESACRRSPGRRAAEGEHHGRAAWSGGRRGDTLRSRGRDAAASTGTPASSRRRRSRPPPADRPAHRAAVAAATRSSPSQAKRPLPSRSFFRDRSLRTRLSLSLSLDVIIAATKPVDRGSEIGQTHSLSPRGPDVGTQLRTVGVVLLARKLDRYPGEWSELRVPPPPRAERGARRTSSRYSVEWPSGRQGSGPCDRDSPGVGRVWRRRSRRAPEPGRLRVACKARSPRRAAPAARADRPRRTTAKSNDVPARS